MIWLSGWKIVNSGGEFVAFFKIENDAREWIFANSLSADGSVKTFKISETKVKEFWI